MSALDALRYRVRALLQPRRFQHELEEEQAFHLELEAMQHRHAGATAEEARFAARRRYGNRSAPREAIRDASLLGRLDPVRQDLRYAARRVRRTPGLTLAVVLTLGLGIGATSAIFAVVHGVLLRALPLDEPERLLRLRTTARGSDERETLSAPNFMSIREESRAFTDVAVFDHDEPTLTGFGEPRTVPALRVSGGFFEVLGARPLLGRTIEPADNVRGAEPVVVLGHALWQQAFGGRAEAIGARLVLNDVARTVVGVMPPDFAFPEGERLWVPLEFDDMFSATTADNRRTKWLAAVARLRPGVTRERAAAELDAIAARLEARFPDQLTNVRFAAEPLHDSLVGAVRRPLLLLLGAVGLVLLIACANVVALLLAQVATRQQELALRTALGAGRRRLVRQLLVESLVLALAGGALGLLVAVGGTRLLLALRPEGIPRLGEVRVDGVVLLFTLAVTLATTLLVGVVPAARAAGGAAGQALREGGRGGVGSRRGTRLRDALVMAELALAVVLLTGAGLLGRSFARLMAEDPGFSTDRGLAFQLALPRTRYATDAEVRAFYERLGDELAALPGVRAVGAVSRLPLASTSMTVRLDVEGRAPDEPWRARNLAGIRIVTPDYFRSMGIPVRQGRALTARDDADAVRVAVLNETAARRFFGDAPAVGQRIRFSWSRLGGVYYTVAGVVGDVRHAGLAAAPEPEAYVPHAQLPLPGMHVVLRTAGDPLASAGAVRRVVRALDAELPLVELGTMRGIVAASVSRPRFLATLLGVFAGMALALSAIGVFGLLSYAVAQQTREIGVRLALGARPGGVVRLVVQRALRLALAGLALGTLASLGVGRVIQGTLHGVQPTDPLTLGGVVMVLALTAAVASALPARRAARVDPVIALRQE